MASLSNSPRSETVLVLEARKSFALGLAFMRRDGSVLDLTGCTVRLVAQKPRRYGSTEVLNKTATLVEPLLGIAQLELQATDLDLDAGEHPFALTLLSPLGYSTLIIKGVLDIQANVDTSEAGVFAGVNPGTTLAAYVEDGQLINVVVDKVDGLATIVEDRITAFEVEVDDKITDWDVMSAAKLEETNLATDTAVAAAETATASATSAAASAAHAAEVVSGDIDAVSAELVGTPASELRGALNAAFGRGISVTDFGATGDGVTNDRAAFQAAIDSVPAEGGMVFIPNPLPGEFYAIDGTLTLRNGITFCGESMTQTIVREVGAFPLFAPTALVRELGFRDFNLQSVGGHIFDLGTTGGLSDCSYWKMTFDAPAPGVSVFYQDGVGDFLWQHFMDCHFIRLSSATVPGFDMRNTNAALNVNRWERCRVTSNNATGGGRYWKLRADSVGTTCEGNTFVDITGELNPAGLIEIDSPLGLILDNVTDYDVAGSYTASIVKIGKAAGGYPAKINLRNVGNRGGTVNGSTVFHVEFTHAVADTPILDGIGDQLGNRYVSFPSGYGASTRDASGATGVLTVSTGSKVLDPTAEGIVFFNGTSLTATLPNPATVQPGRIFRVKNLNATDLTVTAGVSIDGGGTKTLTQYQAGSYVTDGSNYFTI